MTDLATQAAVTVETLRRTADALETVLGANQGPRWTFPVGSPEYPVKQWYCACWHDPSGRKNRGYGHTGVDLNVQVLPRGDVDRGQPVWAIADGVVYRVHYSASYLGSVVILINHQGQPLYVRYWHLARDAVFLGWTEGQRISVGDCIGRLGNYTLGGGGDHLHFDVALDPFEAHWWFTRHPSVRWIDPLPVLRAHLDPALVDAMLAPND